MHKYNIRYTYERNGALLPNSVDIWAIDEADAQDKFWLNRAVKWRYEIVEITFVK